jgi:hypothetical protein
VTRTRLSTNCINQDHAPPSLRKRLKPRTRQSRVQIFVLIAGSVRRRRTRSHRDYLASRWGRSVAPAESRHLDYGAPVLCGAFCGPGAHIAGYERLRGLLVAANIGRPVRADTEWRLSARHRDSALSICAVLVRWPAIAMPDPERVAVSSLVVAMGAFPGAVLDTLTVIGSWRTRRTWRQDESTRRI